MVITEVCQLIEFKNNITNEPYAKIRSLYSEALNKGEKNIQALLVASYSPRTMEVDSRFVNLKTIDADNWIFYSNYKSPKAIQFKEHPNISSLFFWQTINSQIRMKGRISKLSSDLSDLHFSRRSNEKNALAISSMQSQEIDSFNTILLNYKNTLKKINESSRPEYWGGFSFSPVEIEFWKGNDNRLNKRELYKFIEGNWIKTILQP